MTPLRAGLGGAPAAFKSLVPGLQVRACALRGGGSFCPRVQTRRAQSRAGAVPALRPPGPALGTRALAPPRPLPGSASPQPAPQLFPGQGPEGADTSHEASQSWSLSTHPHDPELRQEESCSLIVFAVSFLSSGMLWAPNRFKRTPLTQCPTSPPSSASHPASPTHPLLSTVSDPFHLPNLLPPAGPKNSPPVTCPRRCRQEEDLEGE